MNGTQTSGKRRLIAVLGAALLLAGAGAGGYFYWNGQREIDPLTLYQTAQAERGTVNRTIVGEGTVSERESVSLFVKSAQRVAQISVKEGDLVEEGDLLVEYDIADDLRELERQRDEALLYLSSARLSLENIARPASGNELIQLESEVTAAEKALGDLNSEIDLLYGEIVQQRLRVENLRRLAGIYKDDADSGWIDEEDADTARTNYRVAQAALDNLGRQMEAKEATQTLREQQLEDASRKLQNALEPLTDPSAAARYQMQQNIVAIHELTVARAEDELVRLSPETRSPTAGLVTRIGVEEGGMASAYSPVIEIADLTGQVIRFEAGEYDAPRLLIGQKALVTFPGLSDEPFAGVVSKIGARAELKEDAGEDEVVVPVEITLPHGDERIRVGYSADIEIVTEQREGVIAVPIRALLLENGSGFLYVVEEAGITKRSVTTGFSGDRSVEITEGLGEGEVYILSPLEVDEKHLRG